MELERFFLPRKQFLGIFVILVILSSIPNSGTFTDEVICASKPCLVSKIQNPFILPYSWAFPEKKCAYCGLGENAFAVLYGNPFPALAVLNLGVGVLFLAGVSLALNFSLNQARPKSKKRPGKRKGKRKK